MQATLVRTRSPIPAQAGIGLRAPHVARVLAERPAIPWFEVHSENYFGAGGAAHRTLERIRADYPLSLHGVGLSLGSADPLEAAHLRHLRELVDRYEPALVSEHLSWGAVDGVHFNDLLPLPHTRQALDLVVSHIAQVEEALGRPILIENISSYLRFRDAQMPESAFVAEVARRSGCGLLLDVNNVYVNSVNHGFDAEAYLDAIPAKSVREIHLAGFTRKSGLSAPLLIDSHDHPVAEEVWTLYESALRRFGPQPTLIEWDARIPALETLVAEADRAAEYLRAVQPEFA